MGQFRAGDIRHCFADTSRIRQMLGFDPQVRFEDGMRDLIDWVRDQEGVDLVEQARAELERRGVGEVGIGDRALDIRYQNRRDADCHPAGPGHHRYGRPYRDGQQLRNNPTGMVNVTLADGELNIPVSPDPIFVRIRRGTR